MLPNFMFIGPGRAGSDWITKNLSLHPEIYIPRQKGTQFFTRRYAEGIESYSRIFGNRREPAVGEATVAYLHDDKAAHLVAQHIPDVKLIASLRDPVDRAYSSFGRLAGKAKPGEANYNISFEEKIKITPRILEQGLYARHLRRWFSQFPRENFLILTFDDMKSDPKRFLARIFEFLEVDPEFESPLVAQRLNSTATIGSRSKILYRLYRGMLKFKLFKLTNAIDSAHGEVRKTIDPSTRKRLIDDYYLHDIEDLEHLIDRDLSKWKS